MCDGRVITPFVKRNVLRVLHTWPPAVLLMGLMAMVMSIVGMTACSPPAAVAKTQSTQTVKATSTPRPSDKLSVVNLADLPNAAQRTIALIQKGGPFPFDRDGAVFQNRERLLPQKPHGFYREYAVVAPGNNDRGPMRIVAGEGGELFYTDDRFVSFVQVLTPAATTSEAAIPTTTSASSKTAQATATARPKNLGGLRVVGPSELPREAQRTIILIQKGGPFPFERDGIVFQNRERILPQKPRGYYREYTVITPGADDRGARRIIAGQAGELFYTTDHYASFVRVIQP